MIGLGRDDQPPCDVCLEMDELRTRVAPLRRREVAWRKSMGREVLVRFPDPDQADIEAMSYRGWRSIRVRVSKRRRRYIKEQYPEQFREVGKAKDRENALFDGHEKCVRCGLLFGGLHLFDATSSGECVLCAGDRTCSNPRCEKCSVIRAIRR